MPYIFYNKKPKYAPKPRYVPYRPSYRKQYRSAAKQNDTATVVLKYSQSLTFVKTENIDSGVASYNIWKALSESPFYNKYATIFDQVKINAVKVQIQAYTGTITGSYMVSAAFDRNGISNPSSGMTEAKISSYSSVKSIMVNNGTRNVLYINNYPVTRLEKDQYVPTALVPNIAVSTTDDLPDQTSVNGNMQWAYKPILLVGNKQIVQYVSPTVEVHFAIEVTFRGLRQDDAAIE